MESKFGSEQSSFSDGSTSRNVENETGTMTTDDQHVMDPILGCLRRRVKEESAGEKLLPPLTRSSENPIHTSDPRSFKLQFRNKICSQVFTKETIQGVGGASITVAIVDCHTGQVVTSGPAASAEVDIMVLKGDPDYVNGEDWTSEVFENKIFREKIKGRKNLLQGSLHLKLKEGVSSVGEIHFTHNRHWMEKRQFRLGARVVNNDLGVSVKEAKTDPFHVKDKRMKSGPKRLRQVNINNDPKRLQQILGPGAKLKVPVDHARTCIVTDKIYPYNSPNLAPNTGVVLNDVGQVQGILSEGGKADARKSVPLAFQHRADVLQFDDENSSIQSFSNSLNPSNSSGLGCLDGNNHASSEMNSNYVQTQPSSFFPGIVPSTFPTEDITLWDYGDSSYNYKMELACDQGFNPGDCNLQHENTSVTYAHQENDASGFTLVDGQAGHSVKARKKWPWMRLWCAVKWTFSKRTKVLRL